jgi:uncharacterized protein YpbB
MSSTDTSNHYFQLAARFVNQTNRHLFLTGKAGTGKTTFLRHIREHSPKKMAIVAPTGVAAINAGGVTMHSFFQLPLGAFIPSQRSGWNSNSHLFNTPQTLFKNLRLSNDKRLLMRELELLVIDEVSMLRADLLDAIDIILRNIRRQPLLPFGGVQMLYIGDLFQLPPVVNNEEWEVLKEHYKSPFFFDAQALQQAPPVYLELKKIYRQHEQAFISLLNNIRNNQATGEDLQLLHQHYLPGYEAPDDENCITLTTHNAKADNINQGRLQKLPGKLHEFKAEIGGDFNEKASPADVLLQLKEGAQVMFIKNDKGESRRYYNGKIATIARITTDAIYVHFAGEINEMEIEKETWRNIRYRYDQEADTIDEEELGTFKQYPVRLAWAITIHKSQGLTFNKAIIDAGASFAPGQVYVALSRLTSLQGLVLYSKLYPHAIHTDERVLDFTRSELAEDILQQQLEADQKQFIASMLLQTFDWTNLVESIQLFYEGYEDRQLPDKNEAITWAKTLVDATIQQQEMARRFNRQLEQLLPAAEQDGYQHINQRIIAAADYFSKSLADSAASIKKHLADVKIKQRVKKYTTALQALGLLPERKQQQLAQAVQITAGLVQGTNAAELLQLLEEKKKEIQVQAEAEITQKKERAAKGETNRISLQMFKEGDTAAVIAKKRNLTVTTIEGHLTSFIKTGEIQVTDIVPQPKIDIILKTIEELNLETHATAPVKAKLGDDYSYNEIRAVLNHLERQLQEKVS